MKTVNHLGTDPIGKLVPRIAFPSMLAQFVSVLYSIDDGEWQLKIIDGIEYLFHRPDTGIASYFFHVVCPF